MTSQLRVFVVCPSLRDLQATVNAVERTREARVMGHALTTRGVAEQVHRADVVLLSLGLVDSSSELRRVISSVGKPVVLVQPRSNDRFNGTLVLSGLRAGAVDSVGLDTDSVELVAKLRKAAARGPDKVRRRLGEADVPIPPSSRREQQPPSIRTSVDSVGATSSVDPKPWMDARISRGLRAVGIAVSTGGASTLREIIPRLRTGFPIPVVVVIHLEEPFGVPLVDDLDQRSNIHVTWPREGDVLESGNVYVAPSGAHVSVTARLRVRLSHEPPVWGCRPSADVLFRSMARNLPGQALGLVLTGMGQDGAEGLAEMRERGCVTAVQDRDSSVVYGMPAAARRMGAAQFEVPMAHVADFLHLVVMGEVS